LKQTIEFNKDISKKDGLYPSCKKCCLDYYVENRSAKLLYKKGYREKNKKRISKYRRQHYQLNKAKGIKTAMEWSIDHREEKRVSESNRRARKRLSRGNYTIEEIEHLKELQKNQCTCCKVSILNKYHIDHIIPLSLCGQNDIFNIQLLCPTCNLQKKDKYPSDFMQSKGYLL